MQDLFIICLHPWSQLWWRIPAREWKHSGSQGQPAQTFSLCDLELTSVPQLLTLLALSPHPLKAFHLCSPSFVRLYRLGLGWEGLKFWIVMRNLGMTDWFKKQKDSSRQDRRASLPRKAAQGIRKPHLVTEVGSPRKGSRGSHHWDTM